MDITFRTRKLEKDFNGAVALQKTYGARMARVIMMRMAVLRAARNLELVPTTPPERRHQLVGVGTNSSLSISFTPTGSSSKPITSRFRARTMEGSTRSR